MLSDEERKAIKEVKHFNQLTRYWQEEEYEEKEIAEYITIVLNLIEKQSKEIEEYEKQLDLDYVDKHYIPIERYSQLEKEIEELKNGNIDFWIGDKEIEERIRNKFVSKDKINAILEELDKEEKELLKGTKGQDRYAIKQEYMYKRSGLQLLLEKE